MSSCYSPPARDPKAVTACLGSPSLAQAAAKVLNCSEVMRPKGVLINSEQFRAFRIGEAVQPKKDNRSLIIWKRVQYLAHKCQFVHSINILLTPLICCLSHPGHRFLGLGVLVQSNELPLPSS